LPFTSASTDSFSADTFTTRAIDAYDIDNDGDMDIITGNVSAGNFVYINNNNGASFTKRELGSGSPGTDTGSTFGLAIGDVDGDGLPDIVVGNSGSENKLYLNDGDSFPFTLVGTNVSPDADTTYDVELADLDNDGDLDLIVFNSGINKYYLNNGTATPFSGSVGVELTSASKPSWHGLVHDMDGDGRKDIVVSNYTSSNDLFRAKPLDAGKGNAESLEVDATTGILHGTLTPVYSGASTTEPPNNTSAKWYLSNNGGGYFYQVQPGVEFDFPQSGDDLRWKVELGSLSPTYSPVVNTITVTARVESDNDGTADDEDVCVGTYDPDQIDTDGDATPGVSTGPANGGDACDADDDNDGVLDVNDAFPLNASESVDTDGSCGVIAVQTTSSGNGCGNVSDTDDDNDGILDVNEPGTGSDGSLLSLNVAPSISGSPATTVAPGATYFFSPSAFSDGGDGGSLTASLTFAGGTEANLPSWLVFDTSSGALTGRPSRSDYGVISNVVIQVHDGVESAPTPVGPFNISVLDLNPPKTNISPKTGDYNSDVTVYLECTENEGSGCASIFYRINGAGYTQINSTLISLLIPSSGGNATLDYYSVDVVGNAETAAQQVYRFDLTAPVIAITTPADGSILNNVGAASIAGTATDVDSGISNVQIQITDGTNSVTTTGGSIAPGQSPNWLAVADNGGGNWSYNTAGLNWTDDAEYTITARTVDVAGNLASTSMQFVYYNSNTPAATSLDLNLTNSAIPNGEQTDATLTLTRINVADQDLSGLQLLLHITDPDGAVLPDVTLTANFAGQATISGLGAGGANNVTFNNPGQYILEAEFIGNPQLGAVTSTAASLLVGSSAGFAVLIEGKLPNNSGLDSHNKTANRIYESLKERGFADQDIYYYNYDTNQIGVDGLPNKATIQTVIEGLATEVAARPAPVYVIMVDHGGKATGATEARFYIDNDTITPTELDSWLDTLETAMDASGVANLRADNPRVVIMGACYSGGFVPGLSATGRIIISSSAADEQSYKGPTEADNIRVGEYFLEELFKELKVGETLREAFKTATASTEIYTESADLDANSNGDYQDVAVQHPLLDDDGDTAGTNDVFTNSADGQVAKDLVLGFDQGSITNDVFNPADILSVTPALYLADGDNDANLVIYANDPYQVNQAYVEIRTPNTALQSAVEDTTEQLSNDYIRRAFTPPVNPDDPYTLTYGDEASPDALNSFIQAGKYDLFYYVNDRFTGDLSSAKRSVVYKDRAGNISPTAFDLSTTTPANGADVQTITAFDWDDSTDADGLTYNLVIADDAGFSLFTKAAEGGGCAAQNSAYRQQDLTSSGTFVDAAAGLCDDTYYYWKVEAVDAFGRVTNSNQVTNTFHTNDTNAQIGTIVAMVKSSLTNQQLILDNIQNSFAEVGGAVASGFYNGNYVILTSNIGQTMTVTSTKAGYDNETTTTFQVGDRKTVELIIEMDPAAGTDTDGDGVTDNTPDNCPTVANGASEDNQLDTDSDGLGDACDTDDDNDGMPDTYENADVNDIHPANYTAFLSTTNAADAAADEDTDGISNLEEYRRGTDPSVINVFTDTDNDTILDDVDNCLNTPNTDQLDSDGDAGDVDASSNTSKGGDACDIDDDNDGMSDAFESLYGLNPLLAADAGTDLDQDGVSNLDEFNNGTNPSVDNYETIDSDADGTVDVTDNCPSDANSNQADMDGDTVGDVCDSDMDNDGVVNGLDAFPTNASESADFDNDGTGNNADTDDDADGMSDSFEQLYGFNPLDNSDAAIDTDSDGVSNLGEFQAGTNPTVSDLTASDVDSDSDGVSDASDNCRTTANSNQQDTDRDSIGDVCDSDIDNDGVANARDAFPTNATESVDSDNDGTGNNADSDDDNDGMSDAYEALYGLNPLDASDADADTDGDGISNLDEFTGGTSPTVDNEDPDATAADSDSDGVADVSDNCPSDVNANQQDTDNDGAGNACDTDDDNDGMPDDFEVLYGLNPLRASDADSDTDGDGNTNLQEFQTGTSPSVSNEAPAASSGGGGSLGYMFFAMMWLQLMFIRRRRFK
jgi:hypothetical protein